MRIGLDQGHCPLPIYILPACQTNIHVHLTIFNVIALFVTYFYCLDTDELWFMLIDLQALTWFWESTWTVISYCLKNGRLAPISSIIISIAEPTTSSNIKTLLLSTYAWPLTPGDQKSSPNIKSIIESRVQSPGFVLFQTQCIQLPHTSCDRYCGPSQSKCACRTWSICTCGKHYLPESISGF